jgi:hypothetical protein
LVTVHWQLDIPCQYFSGVTGVTSESSHASSGPVMAGSMVEGSTPLMISVR